MRTTTIITFSVPIPSSIPPASLLDHLHMNKPLFRAQSIDHITDPPSVRDDAFFSASSPSSTPAPTRTLSFREAVPVVKGLGWSQKVAFTATCQNLPSGVRVRADAPVGILLWTEYLVSPRNLVRARPGWVDEVQAARDAINGSDSGKKTPWDKAHLANLPPPPRVAGGEPYDLIEHVLLECNSALMPFVSRSMECAHRELCQKIIDAFVVEHLNASAMGVTRGPPGGGPSAQPPVANYLGWSLDGTRS